MTDVEKTSVRKPQIKEALGQIAECKETCSVELDLGGLALTEIPDQVAELAWLETLWLGGDADTRGKSTYPFVRGIEEISNSVRELPPHLLKSFNRLRRLDLVWNELTALPPEIGQLTALAQLSIHGNALTELPPEIGQLTNLAGLWLPYNRLKTLPVEICNLPTLSQLSLGNNELVGLPPELGQMTNLTGLWLSGNRISKLPKEIGDLTALKHLALSSNRIVELPPEIGRLTALVSLFLDGNQLRTVPPEIGKLKTLEHLMLGKNRLTELPREISQLTALTHLSVGRNRLTALPPEISQLTALTKLTLSGNRLTELDSEISQLTALTHLSVGKNRLSVLPPEISRLTNLKELYVKDNPLEDPPKEIVERGTKHVISYLLERLTLGESETSKIGTAPAVPPPSPGIRLRPNQSGDRLDLSGGAPLSAEEQQRLGNLRNMALAEAKRLQPLLVRGSNSLAILNDYTSLYIDVLENAPGLLGDGHIEQLYGCGLAFEIARAKLDEMIKEGSVPQTDLHVALPLQMEAVPRPHLLHLAGEGNDSVSWDGIDLSVWLTVRLTPRPTLLSVSR